MIIKALIINNAIHAEECNTAMNTEICSDIYKQYTY